MLLEAEDKFYDTLRLGHKHPDTRVDFVVCDAHCMVAPDEAKRAAVAVASPATRCAPSIHMVTQGAPPPYSPISTVLPKPAPHLP